MEAPYLDLPFDWSTAGPNTNHNSYLPLQPPNYVATISSYFRRPSRISKNTNRADSPRSLWRRKTTASSFRQKSSTDGKVSRSLHPLQHNTTGLEDRPRPASWHPISLEAPHYTPSTHAVQYQSHTPSTHAVQYQSHTPSFNYHHTTYTGLDFSEAITPLSQPFADEPFVHDSFTPLDELSVQDFDDRYAYLEEFRADKNPFRVSEPVMNSLMPYWQTTSPLDFSDTWDRHGYLEQQLQSTTADATPLHDTMPDLADVTGSNDLVGMGLYDEPSSAAPSVQFVSASMTLPYRSSLGKGLKLEETFQPKISEDDNEDTDSSEDEDIEEIDSMQTFPTTNQPNQGQSYDRFSFVQGAEETHFTSGVVEDDRSWLHPPNVPEFGWI